jgi:hypothetical protein
MVNYQLAKIYKLVSQSGLIYVGSTCRKLEDRLRNHKNAYSIWKKGSTHYISSFKLFDEGIENVSIELIEEYPCVSNVELHLREGFYIKSIPNVINKLVAGRTSKERYILNKPKIQIYHKEYVKKNWEKVKAMKNRKFNCECGGRYIAKNKYLHMRSHKHTHHCQNVVQI